MAHSIVVVLTAAFSGVHRTSDSDGRRIGGDIGGCYAVALAAWRSMRVGLIVIFVSSARMCVACRVLTAAEDCCANVHQDRNPRQKKPLEQDFCCADATELHQCATSAVQMRLNSGESQLQLLRWYELIIPT